MSETIHIGEPFGTVEAVYTSSRFHDFETTIDGHVIRVSHWNMASARKNFIQACRNHLLRRPAFQDQLQTPGQRWTGD